jgi:ATP-dependent DNA ligase
MSTAEKRPQNVRRHEKISTAFAPMEAHIADTLPVDPGWQYEPKWDGFRCLAFRSGKSIDLRAKSGKALTRYFPEMVTALASLPTKDFVVDGELVVPLAGVLSFDALQARLHPAVSRVRKLAGETPSLLILFDLLWDDGRSLVARPLRERRAALEAFFKRTNGASALRLSPITYDEGVARKWLSRSGGAVDGVVAKRLDEPYRSGERAMVKIKCLRTADCVVGGFRYGTGSRQVGSLLLGLYNDGGKLDHVGFTSGFASLDRTALTQKLEALKGGSGFTGAAPGGPSRWSTERSAEWVPLRPKLIAEVRYDHVTGDRFRHGTKFLRWRPDKKPAQCTFEQLAPKKLTARLITQTIARASERAG